MRADTDRIILVSVSLTHDIISKQRVPVPRGEGDAHALLTGRWFAALMKHCEMVRRTKDERCQDT